MTDIQHKFLLVFKYCIHTSDTCPALSLGEWKAIYHLSQRQSISGIMMKGIEHLVTGGPDEDTVMDWTGEVHEIEKRNRIVDKNVIEVVRSFKRKGFDCCLLKGQGNAFLYPQPLCRTSGDIDIWLRDSKKQFEEGSIHNIEEDIRKIILLVRSFQPKAKAIYHHIDCPDYNGTEVEVHYRPSYMSSIKYNRRLQKWFIAQAQDQFSNVIDFGEGKIAVPTQRFNIVFQMSHILSHFLKEGIGLRQLLDYYYVLTNNVIRKNSDKDKTNFDWDSLFRYLGLRRIAGAIMWILVKHFGMEPQYALVPLDQKRGKFVLNEILHGGNFGMYDTRYPLVKGVVWKNILRLWRDVRFLQYFPYEALSEPLFRIKHAVWRYRHN